MDTDEETRARQLTQGRIAAFEIQLSQNLTPLLRKEMRHVISTYSEALDSPIGYFQTLNDKLTEHWCKIYRDPINHARLYAKMVSYHEFLTQTLRVEYMGAATSDEGALSELFTRDAALLERRRVAMDEDGSLSEMSDTLTLVDEGDGSRHEDEDDNAEERRYTSDFVYPLEEMTVDVGHVEKRLCFAVSENQQSYVAHFVKQCDWPNLALTIWHDRKLVQALRGLTVYPTDHFHYPVLHLAISCMERKYFTDLSSPTTYTISPHAVDLMTRHSSSSSNHIVSPPQEAESVSVPEHDYRYNDSDDRHRGLFGFLADSFTAMGISAGLKSRAHKEPTVSSEQDENDD